MNNIDKCNRQQSCTANICPLDECISDRTYLKGEKICRYVLDFLEGRQTPFDAEIRETELIWKAKYGEGNLQRRLKSRQALRQAFKRALKDAISEDVQEAI